MNAGKCALLLAGLCLFWGCVPQEPGQSSISEPAVESAAFKQEAVVVFMGDLMVHEEQLQAAYVADGGDYDFGPSFEWIAEDIAGADYAVANLETVLAGEQVPYAGYPRFNTPDSFAQALKDAGVDFLTTANNHCMDQGEEGLLRTLQVLDDVGVAHTGTFSSPAESKVSVVEVNGIRIALAAFTYGINDLPAERAGLVNRLGRNTVQAAMQQARAQAPDWIIALPHMGKEYQNMPDAAGKEWADYILSCGANAVIATHPHVLQPIVVRESQTQSTALVAYSLGNFLSSQREPPRDTGVLLKLYLIKDAIGQTTLSQVSVIPVWTQGRAMGGRYVARVLAIDDALLDFETRNALRLQQQSYARLQEAAREVELLYLGTAAARGGREREYILYSADNSP